VDRIKKGKGPAGGLRRQVSLESRRHAVVFLALVLVLVLYLGFTLVAGEKGLLKYLDLEKNQKALLTEIQRAERDNKVLKREVQGLKQDPFYIEKHAREEYGLAKPDELIFQFKEDGR